MSFRRTIADVIEQAIKAGELGVSQDDPGCELKADEHGGDVEWMVRDYSPNNGPLRARMCAKHRAHQDCAAFGWRLERNEGVLRRYRVVVK